ncbi:hypothetical protein ACWD0A_33825 [Streptomyces sp. NPDC002867]
MFHRHRLGLPVDGDLFTVRPRHRLARAFPRDVLREGLNASLEGRPSLALAALVAAFGAGAGDGSSRGCTPSPASRSCCSGDSCAQLLAWRCQLKPLAQVIVLEGDTRLDGRQDTVGVVQLATARTAGRKTDAG